MIEFTWKNYLCAGLLAALLCVPSLAVSSSLKTISTDDPPYTSPELKPTVDLSLAGMNPMGGASGTSVSKAVWYSLLLPGLGDYYLGRKTRAKAFFIAEAAVWTSFIVFEVQGHLREDSYKEFATAFGGVSSTGHSDDYYRILSQYNSSRDYEESIKKDGRFELYPNAGYDALQNYYLSQRISDFEPWEWPSDEKRREYRAIRKGSRQAYRRAMYSVAAGVANRIVSSLFAWKTARDLSRGDRTAGGRFHLQFGHPTTDLRDPLRTGLTIVRTF
jgi:hypothetical protein